jgi:hypothetical protein
MWATAASWGVQPFSGSVGSLHKPTEVDKKRRTVHRHNKQLHRALDAALSLKRKIEEKNGSGADIWDSEEEDIP